MHTWKPGDRVEHAMRAQQFQNWLLDENLRWPLTDAQLLAVMRVAFPLATGLSTLEMLTRDSSKWPASARTTTETGINSPSPISRGMPLSVSYGTF